MKRIIAHPLAYVVGIPSWLAAIRFWQDLGSIHWLLPPLVVSSATVWATLAAQQVLRSGKPQRWYRATLDFASGIGVSRVGGRALHVYGFMRVPEGERPPGPQYACNRLGVRIRQPWHRIVPNGQGELWVAVAFASTDPATGRYDALPSTVMNVWGEQYSADGRSWRTDGREPGDAYFRYRRPEDGSLSIAIPMDPRAPLPEWTHMASVLVGKGKVRKAMFPAMKLNAVRELRIVYAQQYERKPTLGGAQK